MFVDYMVQYVHEECYAFDDAAFAKAIGMEESKASRALTELQDGQRDAELIEKTLEFLSQRQKLMLLVTEQYEIHNQNRHAPKSSCRVLDEVKKQLSAYLKVTPENAQIHRSDELNKQLQRLNDTVENVFCGRNIHHFIGCKAHSTHEDATNTAPKPCEALAHMIEVFYDNLIVPEETRSPVIDALGNMLKD